MLAAPSDIAMCMDYNTGVDPPKEAMENRRKQGNEAVQGDHYHTVANRPKGEHPGERVVGLCGSYGPFGEPK